METLKLDFNKILATLSESVEDIIIGLNSKLEILFANSQAKKNYGKFNNQQNLALLYNRKNPSSKLTDALKKHLSSLEEKFFIKKHETIIKWSMAYFPDRRKPQFILLHGKNKTIKTKNLSS